MQLTEAREVAWQWWSDKTEYARPGRWSKLHYMRSDGRTLCGLVIPKAGDVADFGNAMLADGNCQRCRLVVADVR